MGSVIRLQDVRFAYVPDRWVLDGLTLDLSAGQRVGLIGANGGGKTTLLHLIVGLLTPSAGEITAFGRGRRREKDFLEVRRRAGLLFQDAEDQLFCPTVIEDVAFGPINLGHSRRETRAIAAETLASLGLAGYADRITYKLSAGEKRMVALATVLAMKPDVLLLDEPTANLDGHARGRLLDVLRDRHEAMLVASHDLPALGELCDRVVLLARGRLFAEGPAERILNDSALLAEAGLT